MSSVRRFKSDEFQRCILRLLNRVRITALFNIIVVVICLAAFLMGQADAAWYEAKGYAIIEDGDKASAKRKATQEALKQAMLFAGASVNSVHTLTNGLLESEHTTISSSGEVAQLELIDEVYSGDMVTVSVRADIFAKAKSCNAQYEEKHFSTTRFLIKNRQQLTHGDITKFDEVLTQRFARLMRTTTDTLRVTHIAPHSTQFKTQFTEQNVRNLSQQTNTQYVVMGTINDLSIETSDPSLLTPWRGSTQKRHFGLTLHVYDGINGGLLFTQSYATAAAWTYDKFESVDEYSQQFWESRYGVAVQELIQNALQDIKEAIACQPLTGRVLHVAGNSFSVSLGQDNGISENDELYLYQAKEVIDNYGRKYLQYVIYPGTFVVRNAFSNSSSVVSENTAVMANIQENDFVVKK